jgi:DNA-directed RNA polymerase subunit alpha
MTPPNKKYQPLTIPRVTWNKSTLTQTYGEAVAQPLESGFGITLGNALRRILLGGIEGSAVTSVIIKGVNNEFSSIAGVKEDVLHVCLNIKQLVVRNTTGEPGKLSLQVQGEKVVTGADIVCDEHLEVVNKELILAHVAHGGELEIEFFVESGREYKPAQWPIGEQLQEDNRIYVDALFSPISKVVYNVEKTRVGREIDYDKLTLVVETNGSISPVEALHYAVSVLRTQLEHFLVEAEVPFNDISMYQPEKKERVAVAADTKLINGVSADLLSKPIEVLEFSVRAHNCLINAGIKRIIDLVNMTEDEVTKIKNFGRKSLEEVKEGMKSFGLSFDMKINENDLA